MKQATKQSTKQSNNSPKPKPYAKVHWAQTPEGRQRMSEAQKKRWERERATGEEAHTKPQTEAHSKGLLGESPIKEVVQAIKDMDGRMDKQPIQASSLLILVSATLKTAVTRMQSSPASLDNAIEAWEMVRAASDVLESMVEASMKSKIEQAARNYDYARMELRAK